MGYCTVELPKGQRRAAAQGEENASMLLFIYCLLVRFIFFCIRKCFILDCVRLKLVANTSIER